MNMYLSLLKTDGVIFASVHRLNLRKYQHSVYWLAVKV